MTVPTSFPSGHQEPNGRPNTEGAHLNHPGRAHDAGPASTAPTDRLLASLEAWRATEVLDAAGEPRADGLAGLDGQSEQRLRQETDHLRAALASRRVIEQANGPDPGRFTVRDRCRRGGLGWAVDDGSFQRD